MWSIIRVILCYVCFVLLNKPNADVIYHTCVFESCVLHRTQQLDSDVIYHTCVFQSCVPHRTKQLNSDAIYHTYVFESCVLRRRKLSRFRCDMSYMCCLYYVRFVEQNNLDSDVIHHTCVVCLMCAL